MSRTVVRGSAGPELKRLYQTVKDAQQEAIDKVKDGADGLKIHQGICAVALGRTSILGLRIGCMQARRSGAAIVVSEAPVTSDLLPLEADRRLNALKTRPGGDQPSL